ncbi:unnamed protein product [Pylaiella littoralis]
MADEQPALLARDLRDVTKVPLAKELVKNNVGSTVKNQEQHFVIVSQAASAAASAHYLDPSLQARVQSPLQRATTGAVNTAEENGAAAATVTSGRDDVKVNGASVVGEEVRPAGRAVEETGTTKYNKVPVVIMSDAENYRQDPNRRKRKNNCCIQ